MYHASVSVWSTQAQANTGQRNSVISELREYITTILNYSYNHAASFWNQICSFVTILSLFSEMLANLLLIKFKRSHYIIHLKKDKIYIKKASSGSQDFRVVVYNVEAFYPLPLLKIPLKFPLGFGFVDTWLPLYGWCPTLREIQCGVTQLLSIMNVGLNLWNDERNSMKNHEIIKKSRGLAKRARVFEFIK